MIELLRLGLKIFIPACAIASVAFPRAGFAQQSSPSPAANPHYAAR
jgi:hypothetical protein